MPRVNNIYKFWLFLIFIFNISVVTFGQGCSDAGVCTVGAASIQNNKPDADSLSEFYYGKINIQSIIGSGEQLTWHYTQQIDLDIQILKKMTFQLKLPFTFNFGNLTTTLGIGDIIPSLSCKLYKKKNNIFFATIGLRLPSGKTNQSLGERPLPMSYQSGIGSLDALLAAGTRISDWTAVIGYQHILRHNNQNGFLQSLWSDNSKAIKYNNSKNLVRGNDLMARVDRVFAFKKWRFNPGILFIYRLQKDKYINEYNQFISTAGSDGLSINLNFAAYIPIDKKSQINIVTGIPTLVRHVRPDGLTRTAQLSLSYMFLF